MGGKSPLTINVLGSGERAECHLRKTVNPDGEGKGQSKSGGHKTWQPNTSKSPPPDIVGMAHPHL